ncbi:MAG: hypothetical protein RIQ81_2672 [Pseudomonadota bacterium]
MHTSLDTDHHGQAARTIFGFDALHDFQREVLAAIDAGRDCLAVSPTGSGKTLCYGVPAAMEMAKPPMNRSLVLVVSPLIALMRDQAEKLGAKGIPVASFDSLQTRDDRDGLWQSLASGEAVVAFVSPERLSSLTFRERLAGMRKITLVAIDEAHCTSQWGFNFRPEYRHIGTFLDSFPGAVRLALTATATPGIKADMIANLKLRDPALVVSELVRDNLSTSVTQATSVQDLPALIANAISPETTLIYAPTRKDANTIWRDLRSRNLHAGIYHAGMEPGSRQASQRAFLSGNTGIMVATSAFGLGIDKADIRHVIHAGMPQNIEQYVQETGRAGRDGKPARCTMFFHLRDYHTRKFLIDRQYPEVNMTRKVCEFIAGQLEGQDQYGKNRYWLLKQLAAKGTKSRDAEAALDYALRENLFRQSEVLDPSSMESDLILTAGNRIEDSGAWWRQYEYRRQEALWKLEQMRLFARLAASSTSRGLAMLRNYFKDPSRDKSTNH